MNFLFLAGHESFYLREGWLTKGLFALAQQPELFQSQNQSDAIDELGMGANMVKSLKYWLLYFKVASHVERGQNLELSNFGRNILENDPYIQLTETLWLLHINSICHAPLWEICCKSTESLSYSKDHLLQKLISLVKAKGEKEYSPKTCASYIDSFVNIYLRSVASDIEGNLQSPLSRLKLLVSHDKEISFRTITVEELDCRLIYYILFSLLQGQNMHAVNQDAAYHSCRCYMKMDLTSFRNWLRELERMGFVSVDRAAGLNMINPVREISANDMTGELLRDRL